MQKIVTVSIVSLLVGALLVLTGYFVYTVIKTQQKVEQNTATLSQIVQFLNEQISKSNPTPEVK
jgi:flagellar basal body-associated protein FliL